MNLQNQQNHILGSAGATNSLSTTHMTEVYRLQPKNNRMSGRSVPPFNNEENNIRISP